MLVLWLEPYSFPINPAQCSSFVFLLYWSFTFVFDPHSFSTPFQLHAIYSCFSSHAQILLPYNKLVKGICLEKAISRLLTNLRFFNINHLFYVIHVRINNITKILKTISRDYQQLGMKTKELGAEVVFSSVLPMEGQHPVREWRILEINHWFKGWCYREIFGFLD